MDDECDGYGSPLVSTPAPLGDAVVLGTTRYNDTGSSVDFIGDFNGDGFIDIAVGSPGISNNGTRAGAVDIYLSAGAPVDFSGFPDVRLQGPSRFINTGAWVKGIGDVNADGYDDLFVGTAPTATSGRSQGVGFLVYGDPALPPNVNLATDADATFDGGYPGDEFATTAGNIGDIDGDGYIDLAIGAPGADPAGDQSGAVFIFRGPLSGAYLAGDADVVLTGEAAGDRAGHRVDGVGDVDGDELPDIMIGAPQWGAGLENNGAAYVYTASDLTPGVHSLGAAPMRLRGNGRERLGYSFSAAGDVNDDGFGDYWIGARQAYSGKRGALYLMHGGPVGGGDIDVNASWVAKIRGAGVLDYLGTDVKGGVDFDGDGEMDVIGGADEADGTVPDSGAAFILVGPFAGEITIDPALGRFGGDTPPADTGSTLAVADVNGDGLADWLIGSPGANPTALYRAGAASLFYGGQDANDVRTWYRDADQDTWGSDIVTVEECEPPPGYIERGGDCNDNSAAFRPFVVETNCGDPVDYNCDGSVQNVDVDNDGFDACEGDCDDRDAAVGPGVDEVCFDDFDNDCDGQTDDPSSVDATDWYPDSDEDGYGDRNFFVRACEPPGFFLTPPVTVGGDCVDSDFNIKPGVAEYCDLADNDCDDQIDELALDAQDWFSDNDSDGWGDPMSFVRACEAPRGWIQVTGDCDDLNESINPGGIEVCDGEDNDCDALFYRGGHVSAEAVSWDVRGADYLGKFGSAIARIPDTDDDGDEELAVASPAGVDGGSVYVGRFNLVGGVNDWSADYGGGMYGWSFRAYTENNRSEFGAAIVGGDFDGDGIGDLAVGAPNAAGNNFQGVGSVYIFWGPLEGEVRASDVTARLIGATSGDRVGDQLGTGDLNNDGITDLLIGAPSLDQAGDRSGGIFLFFGTSDRTQFEMQTLDTETRFIGMNARDAVGLTFAVLGDTDGDNFPEIAAGAPDAGTLDTGYVGIWELTPATVNTAIRPYALIGDDVINSQVGFRVASGDVNGDSTNDLVVAGAQSEVWVMLGGGGWNSGLIRNMPAVRLSGLVGQELAESLAVADVNGDQYDDIAVGAPEDNEAGFLAGAIYVLYGNADLPPSVALDEMEDKVGARDCGDVEGAKLLGPGELAEYGTALTMGFVNGFGDSGNVVGGAPSYLDADGAVLGWVTGQYGADWAVPENEELTASKTEWWPDRDTDGFGNRYAESFFACEMHVPHTCDDGELQAVSDPAVVTDCDDLDPLVGPCCPNSDIDLDDEVGAPVSQDSTVEAGNDFTPSCSLGSVAEDLAYEWTAPATGQFVIDTVGSSYDTVLHVYGGVDCDDPIACNDDIAFGNIRSRVTVDVTEGELLLIVVDGYNSNEGDVALNIRFIQPDTCTADDDLGSVTGESVAFGDTCSDNNTAEFATCGNGQGSGDHIYSWTADTDGFYIFGVHTENDDYDPAMTLRGPGSSCDESACDDDSGPGVQPEIEQFVAAGETVNIVVDGYGEENCGDYWVSITFDETPPVDSGTDGDSADSGDSAGPVDCDPYYDYDIFSDLGHIQILMPLATAGPLPPTGTTCEWRDDYSDDTCFGFGGDDLAYLWTVPKDGVYRFEIRNPTFDSGLRLINANSCDEAECDDDGGISDASMIERHLIGGESFVVVVDGYDSEQCGDFELHITDITDPADTGLDSATDSGADSADTADTGANICPSDRFEINDESWQAVPLAGLGWERNLTVCDDQFDWYSFDAFAFQGFDVEISFSNDDADLDLFLLETPEVNDISLLNLIALERSTGIGDSETVSFTPTATGTYYILVFRSSDNGRPTVDGGTYDLRVTSEPGPN